MRKLISLLLIVALLCGLTVPAYAVGGVGTLAATDYVVASFLLFASAYGLNLTFPNADWPAVRSWVTSYFLAAGLDDPVNYFTGLAVKYGSVVVAPYVAAAFTAAVNRYKIYNDLKSHSIGYNLTFGEYSSGSLAPITVYDLDWLNSLADSFSFSDSSFISFFPSLNSPYDTSIPYDLAYDGHIAGFRVDSVPATSSRPASITSISKRNTSGVGSALDFSDLLSVADSPFSVVGFVLGAGVSSDGNLLRFSLYPVSLDSAGIYRIGVYYISDGVIWHHFNPLSGAFNLAPVASLPYGVPVPVTGDLAPLPEVPPLDYPAGPNVVLNPVGNDLVDFDDLLLRLEQELVTEDIPPFVPIASPELVEAGDIVDATLLDWLSSFWSKLRELLLSLVGSFTRGIESLLDAIRSLISSLLDILSLSLSDVREFVLSFWDTFTDFFRDLFPDWLGFWRGLLPDVHLSSIWHYVSSFFSNASRFASVVFRIYGLLPSYLTVPIYASAAVVVIAGIYHKFLG